MEQTQFGWEADERRGLAVSIAVGPEKVQQEPVQCGVAAVCTLRRRRVPLLLL